MKPLFTVKRLCLAAHILSLVFGLAGLLFVLPPAFIAKEAPIGQILFGWSMVSGGIVYIRLAIATVAIYACRVLGY